MEDRPTVGWRNALLAAVPALILALVLYRPWRALPFDVWDFIEFLPILRTTDGATSRFVALVEYYSAQGRMNPLFYLTFVLQFGAFGEDAQAWQLLRWLLMAANVALVALVARRLQLAWPGVMFAAVLFVVATPAVGGWIQLMAEPYVLGLALTGILAGMDFRERASWGARAAVLVALTLAAFLLKEVAATLMGLVIGLAMVGVRGPVDRSTMLSRRSLALALGGLGVVVAIGALILLVRGRPEATGYGMSYGSGELSVGHFMSNLLASTLVYHPQGRATLALIYPANFLALFVLVLAALTAHAQGIDLRRLATIAGLGLAAPILGALVYLPWPKFDPFYALPFFVGPALLLGASMSVLFRAGGARRLCALVALILVPMYAAIPVGRTVATSAANIRLNDQLASLIARLDPADTLVVFDPGGVRRLPVTASDLRGYSLTFHARPGKLPPVAVEAACGEFEGRMRAASARVAALSYSFGCGLLPAPTLRIASEYRYRDWISLGERVDSLVADLSGTPLVRVLQP